MHHSYMMYRALQFRQVASFLKMGEVGNPTECTLTSQKRGETIADILKALLVGVGGKWHLYMFLKSSFLL